MIRYPSGFDERFYYHLKIPFITDVSHQPEEVGSVIPNTEKISDKTDDDKKKETELEKYWHAVRENPMDFTGWTYLLQYVEQEVRSLK